MDLLESIMAERKADVEAARGSVPLEQLLEEAQDRTHHSLSEALLSRSGACIVAEMKRASPSAGLLREDYDPAALARTYARAGASAVSVLTEPRHFLGAERHLRQAREAVALPILRKDFICEPYQVAEAAAWGADVVLLIAAALSQPLLWALHEQALALGLDVLAETHSADEVDLVLGLDRAIIGVNSRNLRTLKTDLSVARRLAERIPPGRLAIAESGISDRAEVVELAGAGYDGFLIGEAIVGGQDPGGALAELLGQT
jgi:indole-3-glycerol phosphate synthase